MLTSGINTKIALHNLVVKDFLPFINQVEKN